MHDLQICITLSLLVYIKTVKSKYSFNLDLNTFLIVYNSSAHPSGAFWDAFKHYSLIKHLIIY